jgi:hypothetical protein
MSGKTISSAEVTPLLSKLSDCCEQKKALCPSPAFHAALSKFHDVAVARLGTHVQKEVEGLAGKIQVQLRKMLSADEDLPGMWDVTNYDNLELAATCVFLSPEDQRGFAEFARRGRAFTIASKQGMALLTNIKSLAPKTKDKMLKTILQSFSDLSVALEAITSQELIGEFCAGLFGWASGEDLGTTATQIVDDLVARHAEWVRDLT